MVFRVKCLSSLSSGSDSVSPLHRPSAARVPPEKDISLASFAASAGRTSSFLFRATDPSRFFPSLSVLPLLLSC